MGYALSVRVFDLYVPIIKLFVIALHIFHFDTDMQPVTVFIIN